MNNKRTDFSPFKTMLCAGIVCILLLAGCGSSMDSEPFDITSRSSVNSGVAVDPYIFNARFEELSADGLQVIQAQSSPSDLNGHFSFAYFLKEGSLLRMKSSSRGQHGNAPYTGLLKRIVNSSDEASLVVSPLTTLIANGMSENDLLILLENAGISGLTNSQLYDDPMAELSGATSGITDEQLQLLRANMAVNTLMLILDDFDFAGGSTSVSLDDCVKLSNMTLNAADFAELAASISGELGGAFIFEDLATAAVEVHTTVATQLRQDLASGTVPTAARLEQLRNNALELLATIARDNCAARLNTVTVTSTGETLFNTNCAGCHNLGSGGTMDLSGDSALLAGKFGNGGSHNGQTLSASEITSVGDYLDGASNTPPPEPPAIPLTGEELYALECQGCHGSLTTSNISDRTTSGISNAINANVGGMSYLTLSSEQLALIAAALPIETLPPAPIPERSGIEVYDQECAGCHMLGSHDTAGNIDLAAKGILIVTKIETGHMGKSLSSTELASLADFANTFAPPLPPATARSAETIYNDICGACHMLNGYDDTGSIDLAGMGSTAVTKVAAGHGDSLSTEEITSLASWLDTFAPAPPPPTARAGETIYNQSCGACHKLYGYDSVGNIDLAGMGSTALTKLATGHGGTLSTEEQSNIAAWLDTFAPTPPPAVDRNGETVYNENCGGCHKLYGYDAVGNVDLASQGSLALTKLATGHGGSVTSGEQLNLANWLDTFAPAPPPVVARGGQEVYDVECAGCHKVNGYDADGTAPDIAGNGSGATLKINGGHNGISLISEELVNLSSWLDTFQPGDPYAGSCNACHGQPPVTGAHEIHTSLAKVGTDCAVCHLTAAHNGSVDLAFPATWDAKSGMANSNGSSCSATRCHGGQTSPNWVSGTLNSATQCSSCHTFGTSEYNGYYSGRHEKHAVDKRYACTTCHDSAKLANGHFSDLSTIAFEQAPSTTIKSSLSYSGGTCQTAGCHGSKRW